MTSGPLNPQSHIIKEISWLGQSPLALDQSKKAQSADLMTRIQNVASKSLSFARLSLALSQEYHVDFQKHADGEGFTIKDKSTGSHIAEVTRTGHSEITSLIQDLWDLHKPKEEAASTGSSLAFTYAELPSKGHPLETIGDQKQVEAERIQAYYNEASTIDTISPYLEAGRRELFLGTGPALISLFTDEEMRLIDEDPRFLLDIHLVEDLRRCLERGHFSEAAVSFGLLSDASQLMINRRLSLNAPAIFKYNSETSPSDLKEVAACFKMAASQERKSASCGQLYAFKQELIAQKKLETQGVVSRSIEDSFRSDYALLREERDTLLSANHALRQESSALQAALTEETHAKKALEGLIKTKEKESAGRLVALTLFKAKLAKQSEALSLLNQTKDHLEIELSSLSSTKASLESRQQELEAACARLTGELEALRAASSAESSEQKERIASLEGALTTSMASLAATTDELTAVRAEGERLTRALSSETAKNSNLEADLTSIKDEHELLSACYFASLETIAQRNEELKAKTADLAEFTASHEVDVQLLADIVHRQTDEIVRLQSEASGIQAQLIALESEKSKAAADVDLLREELASAHGRLDSVTGLNAEQSAKLETANQLLRVATERSSMSLEEIAELTRKLEDERLKVSKLEVSLSESSIVQSALRSSVDLLSQTIEILRGHLDNIARQVFKDDPSLASFSTEALIGQVARKFDDLNRTIERLNEEKAAMTAALSEQEASFNTQIAELQSVIASIQGGHRAEMESKIAEIRTLTAGLAQARGKLESQSAELIANQAAVADIEARLTTLHQRFELQTGELEAARAELASITAAKTAQDARATGLEGTLAQLKEDYDKTIRALAESNESLRLLHVSCESSLKDIESLQAQLATERASNATNLARISTLEETLRQKEAEHLENKTLLEATIGTLTQDIQNAIASKQAAIDALARDFEQEHGSIEALREQERAQLATIKDLEASRATDDQLISLQRGVIEGFERDNEALKSRITALETLNSQSASEILSLKDSLRSYEERLAEAHGIINDREIQLIGAQRDAEALKSSLRAQIVAASDIMGLALPTDADLISASQETLIQLDLHRRAQESRLAVLTSDLSSLRGELGSKNETIALLEDRFVTLSTSLDANQRSIQVLEGSFREQSAELAETQASLQRLAKELEGEKVGRLQEKGRLLALIQAKEDSVRTLQAQLQASESLQAETSATLGALQESSKREIVALHEQIASLQTSLEESRVSFETKNHAFEEIIRVQKSRLEGSVSEITALKAAFETEKARLMDGLEAQVRDLKASSQAALGAQTEGHARSIEELQARFEADLSAAQERFKSALAAKEVELTSRSESLDEANRAFEELNGLWGELEQEHRDYIEKYGALDEENASLTQTLGAFKKDNEALRLALEEKTAENLALDQSLRRIITGLEDELRLNATRYQEQTAAIKASLKILLEPLSSMQDDVEGLKALLDSLPSIDAEEVSTIMTHLEPLTSLFAGYRGASRERITSQKGVLDGLVAQLEDLNIEKTTLLAQKAAQDRLLEDNSASISRLETELVAAQTKTKALEKANLALNEALAGGAKAARERELKLRQLKELYTSRSDMIRVLIESAMPVSDFGVFARLAENFRPTLIKSLSDGLSLAEINTSFHPLSAKTRLDNIALALTIISLPFAGDAQKPMTSSRLTGFMQLAKPGSSGSTFELNIPDEAPMNEAVNKALQDYALATHDDRDFFIKESKKTLKALFGARELKTKGGAGGPRSVTPPAKVAPEFVPADEALMSVYGARDVVPEEVARLFEYSKSASKDITLASATAAQGMAIKANLSRGLNRLFTSILSKKQISEFLQRRYALKRDSDADAKVIALLDPSNRENILTALDLKITRLENYYPDDDDKQELVNQLADEIITLNRGKLLEAFAQEPHVIEDLCAWRIKLGTVMNVLETPMIAELKDAVKQAFQLYKPLLQELFLAVLNS